MQIRWLSLLLSSKCWMEDIGFFLLRISSFFTCSSPCRRARENAGNCEWGVLWAGLEVIIIAHIPFDPNQMSRGIEMSVGKRRTIQLMVWKQWNLTLTSHSPAPIYPLGPEAAWTISFPVLRTLPHALLHVDPIPCKWVFYFSKGHEEPQMGLFYSFSHTNYPCIPSYLSAINDSFRPPACKNLYIRSNPWVQIASNPWNAC